jgi:lipid-binding SYLF domain-containing protein
MDKSDIISENRPVSSGGIIDSLTASLSGRPSAPLGGDKKTFDMSELLKEAQFTFHHIINTEIVKLLRDAKGVAFIKLVGVGDTVGHGILMKHDTSINEWYGPCAINVWGMPTGGMGSDDMHSVFIINDDHFFSTLHNDNVISGNDIAISVGKLGASNVSTLPKFVSYSFCKGSCVDYSFDNVKIAINDKVNHQYYKKEVKSDDIFNGRIKSLDNQPYFELCRQLTTCVNLNDHKMNVKQQQRQRYELNKQTPLYQYYVENDTHREYNYQQLTQLPVLPFIHDIQKKNYILKNTKAWVLGKKMYRRFVDFFHFNKLGIKLDDYKTDESATRYVFSENTPLYQYYMTNKTVEWNAAQLQSLPKFPFLRDVHNYYRYYGFLKRMNPMRNKYFSRYANRKPTKYVFDEMSPLYQYYTHNEKLDEIKYNYKILSRLPRFPYLSDITSARFQLRKYNPIPMIRRRLRGYKSQKLNQGWHLDENIPLCQYYLKDNKEGTYNKSQLSALPKLPYLNDVKSSGFKLRNYNPVNFVKNLYKKYGPSNISFRTKSKTTSTNVSNK